MPRRRRLWRRIVYSRSRRAEGERFEAKVCATVVVSPFDRDVWVDCSSRYVTYVTAFYTHTYRHTYIRGRVTTLWRHLGALLTHLHLHPTPTSIYSRLRIHIYTHIFTTDTTNRRTDAHVLPEKAARSRLLVSTGIARLWHLLTCSILSTGYASSVQRVYVLYSYVRD